MKVNERDIALGLVAVHCPLRSRPPPSGVLLTNVSDILGTKTVAGRRTRVLDELQRKGGRRSDRIAA